MTSTRRLRSTGAAVLVPGRVSYAIAVAMGFYVLALILVFTFLVPRLSAGSGTVVTPAVVVVFAVLLLLAMMFAARTPLHPAAVSPVRDTAADREDDIVEGWAVVLGFDIDSRQVELEVTVPGAGTYRCDVRAERSIVDLCRGRSEHRRCVRERAMLIEQPRPHPAGRRPRWGRRRRSRPPSAARRTAGCAGDRR